MKTKLEGALFKKQRFGGMPQEPSPWTTLPRLFVAGILSASLMLALFGCGGSPASNSASDASGAAQIANPVTTVDDIAAVNEQAGINLVLPEGAIAHSYLVIASDSDALLGEVNFTYDGQSYGYRGQVTGGEEAEDISGFYYDFSSHDTGSTDGMAYSISFSEGGPGYAQWFDGDQGITYSVSMDNGATSSGLSNTASLLISAQAE